MTRDFSNDDARAGLTTPHGGSGLTTPIEPEREPMSAGISFLLVLLLGVVCLVTFAIGSGGNNEIAAIATFVFFPAIIALYFSPTIIAATRHHPRVAPIGVLNFLLGWTILGWVGALVWAYSSSTGATQELGVSRPTLESPPDGDMRHCPYCAEPIRLAAIKCKHCGSDVASAKIMPPDGAANI